MKQILLMIAVVALVGCGKKEDGNTGVVDPAPNSPLPNSSATDNPEPFAAKLLETKAKAEAGDAEAQSNLGFMYDTGQGVEQDFKEAVEWYQKAADQGDVKAQYNLGLSYGKGKGVEQNTVTAYAWWNIAATNGHQDAKKGLSQLAKIMTPAQIAKAVELVKEIVEKNPKLLNKK